MISIKAKNKVSFIGSLFNANSNNFINDINVFRKIPSSLIKSIQTDPTPSFKKEKDSNLKNKWHVCVSYETVKEHINLEDIKEIILKENINLNTFLLNEATHVVTGIDWGYVSFISMKYCIEVDETELIQDEFNLAFDQLRNFDANISNNNLFECEIKKSNDTFGKIITFDQLKSHLNSTPNEIKSANSGKGYQLEFHLTPVDKIKKIFNIETSIAVHPSQTIPFNFFKSKTITINSITYDLFEQMETSITDFYKVNTAKIRKKPSNHNEINSKPKRITEIDKSLIKDYEVLLNLNHENISKFYQIDEINDNVYLIKDNYQLTLEMELIKFEDVNQNEFEIISLFSQLVEAVAYLHSKNILHSYINLKTICVQKKKLKLGGFYFFKQLTSKDECFSKSLNLHYEAPENKIGLPYDVWCIGFVLYQMCCVCNKYLDPMEKFLNNLKNDWMSESPKGCAEKFNKISRFGRFLEQFINYDPEKRTNLSFFIQNDELYKHSEKERKETEQNLKLDIERFKNEFNKAKQNQYEIKRLIDENGSFGTVFEVIDLKSNNQVKSLKRVSMINSNLIREIDNLKILSHRNVIKYYEVFDFKNYVCLINEYCNGGDLRNYLAYYKYKIKKMLPIAKQINLCYQLARGLDYIHSNNVSHRDIKPANILLTRNEIKYADFGFSIQNDSSNSTCETKIGTLNYAAPEILNGECKRYDSKAADIWSLACLFFEIATLEYAFKDKDQLNIIASEETFFQKELPKLDSKHPLREVFDNMLVVKTNSRINANQTYAHMKIIKENYKESPNEISMIKVNDDNYFQANSFYGDFDEIKTSTEISKILRERLVTENDKNELKSVNFNIDELHGYSISSKGSRLSFVLKTTEKGIKLNSTFLKMLFEQENR